jgi:argonaute-like protein implicated in RNA metabolism and viral defense
MAVNPSNTLTKKLGEVSEKLKYFIALKKKQEWDLLKLELENAQLRASNKELTEELKEIHKKHSSLQKDFNKSKNFAKIVTNKLTPTDGLAELKESVERYIREIDKCIGILEDTL